MIISTRLLRALPSGDEFIAWGRVSANPDAVILLGWMPFSGRTSRLVTEAALETDKSQLEG